MCGIAGLIAFDRPQVLGAIAPMSAAIRHRGPDDEGFVFLGASEIPMGGSDTAPGAYEASYRFAPKATFQGEVPAGAVVALGHRRLSILDLSPAGHQPMCSGDGRYWITYNGEIYNYLELREELEALGHRFVSAGDTEVILAAYAQWGSDCLKRFNGMWAFVLVDIQERRLFVARDRFGVKPLYYWISPEGFIAFGSEIKQFTVLPGWNARVNGQRAYDFLNWGLLDHSQETLFQGVYQVGAGQCAEFGFDHGARPLPLRRWYDLKPARFTGDLAQAARQFRDLLSQSVGLRLRADVPVGSCLSGGLDSSSIVCLANDQLRAGGAQTLQKTFSAVSDVKRFDEREYIDEVVQERRIEAHYTQPSLGSLFETLEDLVWHQDEPFASTSIYAQWNVFKLAREQGVSVMLDGQGADEQLAGYHTFFAPLLATMFRRGRWLALWREVRAGQRLHGYGPKDALRRIAGTWLPERVQERLRRRSGLTSGAPEWLDLERLAAQPVNPAVKFGFSNASMPALSRTQLQMTSLPMLLHWEDRDSMAHSIESRVPFLDYRLVEFTLGLPDEYKLSAGVTKRVMREGMKGVLPERIRTRTDKMGFVTPEEVWVRETQPERFRAALKEAIEASRGILRPAALDKLERMIAGQEPFNFFAWRLITFGAWMRRFDVQVS